MSLPAILFSLYLFIGLLLMVVAVAAHGKEKRRKGLESLGAGTELDAVLLIFIALLWPIWVISFLGRKEGTEKMNRRQRTACGL